MAKKRTDLIYTLLGYIVILAILVVVVLIMGEGAYLLLINGIRPSVDSLHKWIGLTGSPLLTFAFAIKESTRHWHNKLFWAALTGLLIVHLACFLVLFNYRRGCQRRTETGVVKERGSRNRRDRTH